MHSVVLFVFKADFLHCWWHALLQATATHCLAAQEPAGWSVGVYSLPPKWKSPQPSKQSLKNHMSELGMVVHTCNPSYFHDLEDHDHWPAQAKKVAKPISTNKSWVW
jgi:hypothetical protein